MIPRKKYVQPFCFLLFLFVFFTGSLFLAVASAGPIVLGTELNTNGMVEYLCLGMSCESVTNFK